MQVASGGGEEAMPKPDSSGGSFDSFSLREQVMVPPIRFPALRPLAKQVNRAAAGGLKGTASPFPPGRIEPRRFVEAGSDGARD